jgi:transglycosylase-like protein with SLT domain/peptidase M23-like protein
MSVRRKLKVLAISAGSAMATMAMAVLPTAAADQCKVTVTLLTGQTLTFEVNAPSGTPASSLVPPGTGPVKNVQASCTPTPTTTTSTTTTSTTTTSRTTTSTTTTSSHSKQGGSHGSSHNSSSGSGKSSAPVTKRKTVPSDKTRTTGKTGKGKSKNTKTKTKPQPPTTKGGVPTPANPSFSFALPGPAPLGVPNFFIDSFQIPPFLLPIYQAAGIQYDVPWQILAAINEIETDYGRNLSVSSAGAVGWMQFLPSTWKRYGMDVTGTGYADPYNPVDAIFAAARYLHAAGASKSIPKAIFSYNHASWYVQSVILRAKLIGGMPNQLVGALSGLVEGHFPVAAAAKYADSAVLQKAKTRVKSANAAVTINSAQAAKTAANDGTNIFAKTGSPVIAVNDGKVVKVGQSQKLGNYVELQDATGNVYTYAHLASIPKTYPVPKLVNVTANQIDHQLSLPPTPAPSGPATAGAQRGAAVPSTAQATNSSKTVTLPVTQTPSSAAATDQSPQIAQPLAKERLFAHPYRPASYAAGGNLQVKTAAQAISDFRNYFSDVLHLGKNQYTLRPLKAGATVVAGTILGRIGKTQNGLAPHLQFLIRPAGKNAPYIDPKPILDGWKLLEATAVYRANGVDPFAGAHKNASIGQLLLMSKEQLTNRVLADPHVKIYACGRRDIQAGLIDRRILGVIEFLSASQLYPTVSGLECGHSVTGANGVDPAGASGASMDISAINGIPVLHHQGKGSITDIAVRRLLTLQGLYSPDQIISTMSYKGHNNTIAMPDHANRIQITYTPLFGQNKKLSNQVASLLKPSQWIQLINRIGKIPEPVVPIAPSKYAIKIPVH